MRKLSGTRSIFILLFFVFGCDNPAEEFQYEIMDALNSASSSNKASKITGTVQVAWKGKGGSGMVVEKLIFAEFNALKSPISSANKRLISPKGFFSLSVYKTDYSLERKIVAKVIDVGFGGPEEKKGWVYAEVISDTKCGDLNHGGCSDSGHTDGGCSHDDEATHDDGCSHDTGTAHDDTGTDGGCDHDDSDTDEGCDHDDTGTDHDGGSGGKPDDKGGKGKKCREGQFLVVKMHDKGSPGTKDGITWKWLQSIDGFSIESEPRHLCKKTILSGNLVVHIK